MVSHLQPDPVFHGTPVTKETFVAWKERFDAEMAANDCHGNKEVKLTGMIHAVNKSFYK